MSVPRGVPNVASGFVRLVLAEVPATRRDLSIGLPTALH
jgi:hypothetical protein